MYIIYTYIFIHIQFMFSCWMYFYEILTRTKADKQAFHISAFDHLQNLSDIKSHSTCSLIGEKNVWQCESKCVCVCMYEWMYTHLEQPASHLLRRGYSFINVIIFIWICFWLVFNWLTGHRHWRPLLSASLISSWIFFFSNNCLKQLLEYCPQ